MKSLTILCTLSLLITIATQSYASETQIDFVRQSGGGYLDDDMYTTATGINGSIHWICDLPAFKSGVSSTYYHMAYLIDGISDNTANHIWMPQTVNNSGIPCQYLRIEFPEAVYLTKIRTYNVGYVYTGDAPNRWMESFLMISQNGVDYTMAGDVSIDSTPEYTDYVDIEINDWVQVVEYQPYEDGQNTPNYYSMAEIIMFTDDNPLSAVPEPASIMLIGSAVAGFVLRRRKK